MLLPKVAAINDDLAKIVCELKETWEKFVLYKKVIAQGGRHHCTSSSLGILKGGCPKPKAFKNTRNTKEIYNFLWSLEQYFLQNTPLKSTTPPFV